MLKVKKSMIIHSTRTGIFLKFNLFGRNSHIRTITKISRSATMIFAKLGEIIGLVV